MKKLLILIIGLFCFIPFTDAHFYNSEVPLNSASEKNQEKDSEEESGGLGNILQNILGWILIIGSIILILYFFVKFSRLLFELYDSKNLVYMKITLPKADSKLDKEKETKKDFKEKIGIMTMFLKSIHKISDVGLSETILNFLFKHAKISFELVYNDGKVDFFVVVYKSYVNLVSQQITSTYTDAEVKIVDKKKEYVDLNSNGYKLKAVSLGKIKDDFFPIKVYKYLENDPLNNFTNIFGSLNKEDRAVFQVVLKPVGRKYNERAKEVAGLVSKGKYKNTRTFKHLDFLRNPVVAFIQGPDSVVNDTNMPGADKGGDSYKIFNQAETEAHKAMGDAASQPAFESSIRILVSSKDKRTAIDGSYAIAGAATIFTDEYNNALDNPQFREDAFDFIYTPVLYFGFKHKLVGFLQNKSCFSVDEVSTIIHFPDINYNRSPIINWLEYKKLPPPPNMYVPTEKTMVEEGSTEGRTLGGFQTYKDATLLGYNEYRNKKTPIYFARKDRGRHHYIIGKSGGGKSVFINYLARQDIRNGDGVCVIDPHGDLVEDTLLFTPKYRVKDTIVFDPADDERPMGLNILDIIATDPDAKIREMDRAALDATEIFIKIYGNEIFGPRIQHYFRNGALTLMEDFDEGGTLIDVPRLFTDDAFMRYKTAKVRNPVVKNFWDAEYANTGDREKQEMIPFFSSKFGPFITNTTIRNIIGQTKSAFNLRELMDNQKILLVNLSKGKIGALNAQLLGLIFVSKLNMAAMSRADMDEKLRKDFFLYVDEFQNFATDTFGEILSEARKYKLALIMAHQFIAQIGGSGESYKSSGKPALKDAVFGNVGTITSFKVGAEDAEYLEKEYAPLLSQQDIIGIANYTTYTKLNINNASSRPFDFKTLWDKKYENKEISDLIKKYSRMKFGKAKKIVNMDIEGRLGMLSNEEESTPNNDDILGNSNLGQNNPGGGNEFTNMINNNTSQAPSGGGSYTARKAQANSGDQS